MEWWNILGIVILEISATLFFSGYFIWRGSPDIAISNNEESYLIREKNSFSKGVNVLYSPGVFATSFMAYVAVTMFLFIPLHPNPSNDLQMIIITIIILTLLIYPPILTLTITRILVAKRSKQIISKFNIVQMFFRSLSVTFFGVIMMWFGVHS